MIKKKLFYKFLLYWEVWEEMICDLPVIITCNNNLS